SIAPLLETLIASNPREAAYRGIQLRALRMSGRPDEADAAFERWVALDRNDGAPYRAYSRLLLEAGETAAADSVLRRARAALGGSGTVALELAQTRAAMGLWHPSAVSWRQALEREPYLADAASFALAPTPPDQRTAVSAVFSAPPVDAAARQTLAALHLGWGDPFAAWRALRTLPPDDSSATSWLAFADQAEAGGAWPAARD